MPKMLTVTFIAEFQDVGIGTSAPLGDVRAASMFSPDLGRLVVQSPQLLGALAMEFLRAAVRTTPDYLRDDFAKKAVAYVRDEIHKPFDY